MIDAVRAGAFDVPGRDHERSARAQPWRANEASPASTTPAPRGPATR
ncbi:MAG TPA: hypothetical protein GX403_17070 [Rhodocyclaceae bacterium]|nr:hypothetical protein [Rhodocyclaceae bacterium]